MNQALLSTGNDEWETPKSFFEELDKEFGFTLDVAASDKNAKCNKYFTKEQNGLLQDWGGETVFCNPPYSRKGNQNIWIKKCFEESKKPNTTVVALIPARTDTARFHDFIQHKAEIRFLRGRLVFEYNGRPIMDKQGKPQSAPFPSMICIWKSKEEKTQISERRTCNL